MRPAHADGLTELIAYAQRTVPFYQGVTDFPVLTRDEIRRQGARLWSTEGDPRTWKRTRTSGTTGEPLEVVLDRAAQLQEQTELAAHLDRLLGRTWRTRNVLHLTLHRAAISRATPSPWHPPARLAKWNLSRVWGLDDDGFRAAVGHLDGQVVTAMPSTMALLTERIAATGARVSPLAVVLSGETAGDAIRAEVAAVLSTRVTAIYTLAEVGVVGTACAESDGYHPTGSVHVEILPTGEVVVTPLINRAMPLIRYRSGDHGRWAEAACACGPAGPVLRLASARPGNLVIEAGGVAVNAIDFVKLTAALEVDVAHVGTAGDGMVVEYRSTAPIPYAESTVLVAAVRRLVGRPVPVHVRRVNTFSPATAPARGRAVGQPDPLAPPPVLDPAPIADWLRAQLTGRPGVRWAGLTGSALDPAATSRFSDIDLIVLVDDDPVSARRRDMARALHEQLPTLRINVATAADLADSALVVARLHAEHRPVLGEPAACPVPFPDPAVAAAEGRIWAQNARAVLWTRATDPGRADRDVLREAYFATKYALDALRYHALRSGHRRTDAGWLLDRAPEWKVPDHVTVAEAAGVAREHRPPPAAATAGGRYLEAALGVVEWLIDDLRIAGYLR